jgi:hypothetical protein
LAEESPKRLSESDFPTDLIREAQFQKGEFDIDYLVTLGNKLDFVKSYSGKLPPPDWNKHPRVIGSKDDIDTQVMFIGYMMVSTNFEKEKAKQKGVAFLKAYWTNIRKETCEWFKNNSGVVGDALLVGTATAVALALPPPFNWAPSIAIIMASILIKSGLETICDPTQGGIPGVF